MTPCAVKALGEMAEDPNPQVRQVAVYALGFFGGPASDQVAPRPHPLGRGPLHPV